MKICIFAFALMAVAYSAPAKPLTVAIDPDFLAAMANSTHYEDPKPNGCLSDEVAIQIQGIKGDFCTPKCTGIFKTKCPTDVPSGVTATPRCALMCSPSTDEKSLRAGDAQCGTGACKPIQGLG